jgi:hypothetical protein
MAAINAWFDARSYYELFLLLVATVLCGLMVVGVVVDWWKLRGLPRFSLKRSVSDAGGAFVKIAFFVVLLTCPFCSWRQLEIVPKHVRLVQGGGEQTVNLDCKVSDHTTRGDPHYTFGVGQPQIDVANRVADSIRVTIDAPEGVSFTPREWVLERGSPDQTVRIRTSANLRPGSYVARVTVRLNDRPYLVSSLLSVDIDVMPTGH